MRTVGGSVVGTGVVALLVVASVSAGLHLPEVEYLKGYPAAARLDVQRPAGGFVPLAGRFIAQVLGLGAPGEDSARGRASDAGRSTSARAAVARSAPRVSVSHPFTNDAFARAYVVPEVPFTARTDTRTASREANEPSNCSGVGGTAWYRFVATRDQLLLATTFGSDYAAVIGVFAGEQLHALTPLGCGRSATGNAQVGFRARKGQAYAFQVSGLAAGGNLVFNLDPLGRTARVSVTSSGQQANSYSYTPVVSADGRFVAFHSAARLTPDSPSCAVADRGQAGSVTGTCPLQVFVHDRVTHVTSLVSVSSTGEVANGSSAGGSISGDGRYVAFFSSSTNLQSGGSVYAEAVPEPFRTPQIYVRDRFTGVTELVSESVNGGQSDGWSYFPSISADGRYVAFASGAQDLTPEPAPQCGGPSMPPCATQIYVRDRIARTTTRASMGPEGEWGDGDSDRPAISADGQAVAFRSFAANLVTGDVNAERDMFVRDLRAGVTELVSVSTGGDQTNARSGGTDGGVIIAAPGSGYISADGRYVVFQSEATNLVPGDTNDASDFFVRDRRLGTTVRASVSSSGAQGRVNPTPLNTAGGVAISADGRYVAFDSALLFEDFDDDAAPLQIYVRDLVRGVTLRVSISSLGDPGDDHSMAPFLSADGGVVAFSSSAGNLVAHDTNTGCIAPANTTDNCSDIFVHEMSEYTRVP